MGVFGTKRGIGLIIFPCEWAIKTITTKRITIIKGSTFFFIGYHLIS